ncbi:O-antigen ligase family protein [uncultured Duncaniella sp.]|uniref:O-antigen ligase family protein n=2 Tax=uncultured Duncaniella sp. TaxID=2768039 RepID=UPI002604C8DE|nr:O-antigen ligase family protein [uncultured Duncaniella sp.]
MALTKKSLVSLLWIYFIIFWGTGFKDFIPMSIRTPISLILFMAGFIYAFKSWSHSLKKIDLAIFTITILIPIVCSIQAYRIFHQPIFMGIASLRSIWIILLVYVLKNKINTNTLIHKICNFTLLMMILDIILLYIFDIDNIKLSSLTSTGDDIVDKTSLVENELRGKRLAFGCEFIIVAMAWWSYCAYTFKDKIAIRKMIFTIIFTMFVSKGRIQLVTMALIWVLPYLINFNYKSFKKILSYAILTILILFSLPAVRQRFIVIGDLFGVSNSAKTGDFSGVARLNEVLLAFPYIKDSPIFGSGNISYHFNNGFEGCLGDYFFVADIGIVGMIFIGGLFLCLSYLWLFISCSKYNFKKHTTQHLFVKICCIIYSFLPFMGLVPLIGENIQIMTILLLGCFSLPQHSQKTIFNRDDNGCKYSNRQLQHQALT